MNLVYSKTHMTVRLQDSANRLAEVVYSPIGEYRPGDVVEIHSMHCRGADGQEINIPLDDVVGCVDVETYTVIDEVVDKMEEMSESVAKKAKANYKQMIGQFGFSHELIRKDMLEMAATSLLIMEMLDNNEFALPEKQVCQAC